MSGIFTRIINGEIPSYKIYEDDKTFAFLDINPVSEGHTLVIPKKEIDLIWDLEADDYKSLMDSSKRISKAIQKSVKCIRVGMAVVGLEVPHAHIHLMPLNNMEDFSFKKKIKLEEKDFIEVRDRIISNL